MAYVYDDTGEHETLPSRQEVLDRLRNWDRQLNSLFDEILLWIEGLENCTADRSQVVPYQGQLMKATGVGSVKLPSLVIQISTDNAVWFRPEALWMLGGNGQVAIRTVEGHSKLVDIGSEDKVDWVIYPHWDRFNRQPFERGIFRRLLGAVQ
jgi:hypothetical protein